MITTTLNKIAAAWAAGDAAWAAGDAAGDAQKREFLRIVEEGK